MAPVMPWWIIENTLLAGFLALLVVLVSRIRRVPPVVRHGLWLIVLIKLVVPPVFSLGISVPAKWDFVSRKADTFGQREEHEQDAFEFGRQEQRADPPADTNSLRIGACPPLVRSITVDAFPEHELTNSESIVPFDDLQSVARIESETADMTSGEPPQPRMSDAGRRFEETWSRPVSPSAAPATLVFSGVLTGTFVAVLLQCARLIRIRRLLNRTVDPPVELTNLVIEIAARLGVSPPAVLTSNEAQSPFVCALGRPVLVWPASRLT